MTYEAALDDVAPSPHRVLADKGYSSKANRASPGEHGDQVVGRSCRTRVVVHLRRRGIRAIA